MIRLNFPQNGHVVQVLRYYMGANFIKWDQAPLFPSYSPSKDLRLIENTLESTCV